MKIECSQIIWFYCWKLFKHMTSFLRFCIWFGVMIEHIWRNKFNQSYTSAENRCDNYSSHACDVTFMMTSIHGSKLFTWAQFQSFIVIFHFLVARCLWWRHQMEIFSALLALCEGNPPVTGGFPSQRPVRCGALMISLIGARTVKQTIESLVIWDTQSRPL